MIYTFCFVCEIFFTLYEKYLLLSGRAWVYFHPGAVKSRQSASCWRQPILNPILCPFPKIILPPRYLFIYINELGELWTWLNELHFQYSKAELCRGQIFTNDSRYCANAMKAIKVNCQSSPATSTLSFSPSPSLLRAGILVK